VTVVEIAKQAELEAARLRLKDVTDWLSRHGTPAQCVASVSTGDDAAQLNVLAQEHAADIIVAGAYGHSRLREWALGGVTRDLLLSKKSCSLLSH
jgi:nucleotide-binding universal stress UspA family protein